MDGDLLYPRGFHPVAQGRLPNTGDFAPQISRCKRAVKYYFIDFETSVKFPSDDTSPRLVVGSLGRDRDVPELSDTVPYDPFKVDIFTVGNIFKTVFLEVSVRRFVGPVAHAKLAPGVYSNWISQTIGGLDDRA